MRLLCCVATAGTVISSALAYCEAAEPKVRPERPRVFLRAKSWDGPSIEQIKTWLDRDEYKLVLKKFASPGNPQTINFALMYLLKGDEAAGKAAIERLKQYQADTSESPSYTGIVAERAAAVYDWLHDHPAMTPEVRKSIAAELERAGDDYYKSLKAGGPSTPFYSRVAGAMAGLTAIGLALHGDSPKADEYVRFAADYLKTKNGTIREVEDGAAGGASYAYHHMFTDLGNIVGAWRSATDWDAAAWIKENQGNWLERQVLFQMWMTYPNRQFVKEGDVWGVDQPDASKFTQGFDVVTGITRNGFGRTWADEHFKHWGERFLHPEFVWEYAVFNNPDIPAKPLSGLPRTEVFSPKLHGYVCWRSAWAPDSTIIHFKCGETVDHHGTYDQGKFIIYRQTPLAIKNGAYIGYKTPHHMYYKSPWSANCVVFTGPNWDGMQPKIDFDGTPSWAEWKAERDKTIKHPQTGILQATEANDKFARAIGDLSGSCPPGTKWTRELVFLGYKYLIVVDRVKAAKDIQHRWTLHTINQPKIDRALATADNGPSRLFCKTLLPAAAKLTLVGGEGHEYDYNGKNRLPDKKPAVGGPESQMGAWRLDVTPADGDAETLYVHVLYPTETKTEKMPESSLTQADGRLLVTVGDLTHAFTAPSGGR